jgi:hypothetical protein
VKDEWRASDVGKSGSECEWSGVLGQVGSLGMHTPPLDCAT